MTIALLGRRTQTGETMEGGHTGHPVGMVGGSHSFRGGPSGQERAGHGNGSSKPIPFCPSAPHPHSTFHSYEFRSTQYRSAYPAPVAAALYLYTS